MMEKVKFTLIELLVIIAIVGILASLLLPALSDMRERCRRVASADNLKQIGLAMIVYAYDYNSFFPNGGNNAAGLYKLSLELGQTSSLLINPSTKDSYDKVWSSTMPCDYSYYSLSNKSLNLTPASADEWGTMPDTGLVADKRVNIDNQNHKKKFGNVLFSDGHVKGFSGIRWYANSESNVGNQKLSEVIASPFLSSN